MNINKSFQKSVKRHSGGGGGSIKRRDQTYFNVDGTNYLKEYRREKDTWQHEKVLEEERPRAQMEGQKEDRKKDPSSIRTLSFPQRKREKGIDIGGLLLS